MNHCILCQSIFEHLIFLLYKVHGRTGIGPWSNTRGTKPQTPAFRHQGKSKSQTPNIWTDARAFDELLQRSPEKSWNSAISGCCSSSVLISSIILPVVTYRALQPKSLMAGGFSTSPLEVAAPTRHSRRGVRAECGALPRWSPACFGTCARCAPPTRTPRSPRERFCISPRHHCRLSDPCWFSRK